MIFYKFKLRNMAIGSIEKNKISLNIILSCILNFDTILRGKYFELINNI